MPSPHRERIIRCRCRGEVCIAASDAVTATYARKEKENPQFSGTEMAHEDITLPLLAGRSMAPESGGTGFTSAGSSSSM